MRLFLLVLLALAVLFGKPELLAPAHAQSARLERVGDLARFQGVRSNSLVGYGLVVGLPNTGDDNLAYTIQSMRSTASALGVQLPPGVNPALKNAAAVMITAELPAFAKPGQRIDVTISALGGLRSGPGDDIAEFGTGFLEAGGADIGDVVAECRQFGLRGIQAG